MRLFGRKDELLARDWKTADGVKIVDGLRVWTNDLETGRINMEDVSFEQNENTGEIFMWFRVIRDYRMERGVLQSNDRVAVRNPFDGKTA